MHEKSGRREWGERKKRKRETSTEEATVRRRQEDKGKEEQRLSSQNPKLKRLIRTRKQRRSESGKEAVTGRGTEGPEKVGSESGRQG